MFRYYRCEFNIPIFVDGKFRQMEGATRLEEPRSIQFDTKVRFVFNKTVSLPGDCNGRFLKVLFN